MAKILLVDDDTTLRQVMGWALEDQGFECEHAPNGRIGLEKLCEATVAREPYDCILLDIVMPEVDGWQFLEALKSNPLWRHTKVVVLSGHAGTPRDMARALAMDCVHFEKRGQFVDLLGQVVGRLVAHAH
jgi:CheY-like chemotaxis protein